MPVDDIFPQKNSLFMTICECIRTETQRLLAKRINSEITITSVSFYAHCIYLARVGKVAFKYNIVVKVSHFNGWDVVIFCIPA